MNLKNTVVKAGVLIVFMLSGVACLEKEPINVAQAPVEATPEPQVNTKMEKLTRQPVKTSKSKESAKKKTKKGTQNQ